MIDSYADSNHLNVDTLSYSKISELDHYIAYHLSLMLSNYNYRKKSNGNVLFLFKELNFFNAEVSNASINNARNHASKWKEILKTFIDFYLNNIFEYAHSHPNAYLEKDIVNVLEPKFKVYARASFELEKGTNIKKGGISI